MFESIEKRTNSQLSSHNEGLILNASILSFDAAKENNLCFLSSPPKKATSSLKRIIATEETLRILGKKSLFTSALVCQYNRPFSIGNLKLELFPSGHCLGGALLYLEYQQGSMLYAPRLLLDKVSYLRNLQLREANTLVLKADQPLIGHQVPSRHKEKERLIARVLSLQAEGLYPQIFCKSLALAQEITLALSKEKVSVVAHPQIYRLNKIHETFGTAFVRYSMLSKARRSHDKVILMPLELLGTSNTLHHRPVLLVEDYKDSLPRLFSSKNYESFFIREYSFGHELESVIKAVKPKTLYFFGGYANEYKKYFSHAAKTVDQIFSPDKPPLF